MSPNLALSTSLDEIERIFEQQGRRALLLRNSNATERSLKLKALQRHLSEHREAIYHACWKDFRKPQFEVDLTELTPVLTEIQHSRAQLARWMKGKHALASTLMFGSRTQILPQPKGRSLIIAPWSFPFNLTLMPLVSAVAAGCTAIIKPSEHAPHCNRVLQQIIAKTFPAEEVSVCLGGAQQGEQLSELPFDHVFFTGSQAVGQKLLHATARNFASVTLEMGGKSPAIVDESADIKKAARNLLWGKFHNAGQSCLAPDHVFVHESIKASFLNACKKTLEEFYGHEPRTSVDFARMINDEQFLRVKAMLAEALDAGARLEAGGATDLAQRFVAPTILSAVPEHCQLSQKEIFGPVLPVIGFRQLDDVIDHINQHAKPLALYAYGKNRQNLERLVHETSAGGTCINQCVLQYLQLNAPFGGIGPSGIGRSHGFWGFEAFSHLRTVVTNRFSLSHWLAPPYTDFGKRMLSIVTAALK